MPNGTRTKNRRWKMRDQEKKLEYFSSQMNINKIWTGEWKGFGLWIKKLCRDEIYQNKWEALRRSIYSHWCVCNTLILLDKGAIDQYIVLSLDEMYLDKGESYQGGKVLGKDDNGKLYKGFLAFMIVVVWKNIPCVVQAILEISLTGALVKKYIEENFHALSKIGFKVRAVVAKTTRPTFRDLLHSWTNTELTFLPRQ